MPDPNISIDSATKEMPKMRLGVVLIELCRRMILEGQRGTLFNC